MQSNLKKQNSSFDTKNTANHIALIMDGNGRWAELRGLPRSAGHKAGLETVRRLLSAAPELGVSMMTLYAFSVDNWKRPKTEIALLMGLLEHYLQTEIAHLRDKNIRFVMLGRRDRLPAKLMKLIEDAEQRTADCTDFTLRLALDYSARESILAAAKAVSDNFSRDAFSRAISGVNDICDVDLLIRTSGEQRLSDFLLWECAYAEFYFTDIFWPDFSVADLGDAIAAYQQRNRRFGGLQAASVAGACSVPA